MGVVADVREIIQDLVAPELREIGAKLEALAQLQGAKLDGLEQRQDSKLEALEQRQGAKLDAMEQRQGAKLESLAQAQGAMKTELLEAIVRSEERVMLALKVALLSQQNEQLMKQVSELRKPAQ